MSKTEEKAVQEVYITGRWSLLEGREGEARGRLQFSLLKAKGMKQGLVSALKTGQARIGMT